MKNIKSILLALFILTSLNLIAQDTDTRPLDSFRKIKVSGNIDVTMFKGNENSAEITIEEAAFNELLTEIEGDVLIIKFKKGKNWDSWKKDRKAYVNLTYKSINAVDLSAGSSLLGNDVIKVKSFVIDVSSGASSKLKFDIDELHTDASSGATVKVSGFAIKTDVDISSGASYFGDKLESKYVVAESSSGSNAKVWASYSLEAEATSGGSIKYKGDPEKVDLDSGFSGSISQFKGTKKSKRK